MDFTIFQSLVSHGLTALFLMIALSNAKSWNLHTGNPAAENQESPLLFPSKILVKNGFSTVLLRTYKSFCLTVTRTRSELDLA